MVSLAVGAIQHHLRRLSWLGQLVRIFIFSMLFHIWLVISSYGFDGLYLDGRRTLHRTCVRVLGGYVWISIPYFYGLRDLTFSWSVLGRKRNVRRLLVRSSWILSLCCLASLLEVMVGDKLWKLSFSGRFWVLGWTLLAVGVVFLLSLPNCCLAAQSLPSP